MVIKKKYANTYYTLLLGVLFVIFFGLFSNSYAMTEEEFEYYFDEYVENILTSNFTYYSNIKNLKTSILTRFNTMTGIESYNSILFNMSNADSNPPDRLVIFLFNNGETTFFNSGTRLSVTSLNSSYYSYLFITGLSFNANYIDSGRANTNKNFYAGNSNSFNYYGSNVNCLTNSQSNLPNLNEFINNSITLSATSHSKFNFNDKNQLQVNIDGDWSIGDFSFYIQKYDNGEWSNYTDVNDYYRLNNYSNPYYIFWHNINYFPVGTYRYMADYLSTGEQLYYSNDFQITSSSIDNPTSGTIDNGNIDIDIDTGKTVDDIKDYLGSPANFDNALTQDDIDNALDLDFMDNPYENFIFTFFDGLISSFTDEASDISFKVHTWGENRVVHVSDFTPNYNNDIRTFLTITSTIVWCFVIVKWCSKILDGLTHMDLKDSVDLIDAHYSDLF